MSGAVTQAARDAAAPIFDAYNAPNYAELCRKGRDSADGLIVVRMIAKAIADERERCAQIAEQRRKYFVVDHDIRRDVIFAATEAAAAIRSATGEE
jgi:hypothetical protein